MSSCFNILVCRLEKIVFGDTKDIIDNLPNEDETVPTKAKNEPADVDEEDGQNEERKAAWVDDDDLNYEYVRNRKSSVTNML